MIGILRAASNAGGTPVLAISLTDQSILAANFAPGSATAVYGLGTDGIAYRDTPPALPIAGQWLNPPDATAADLYECRATVTSGALSTGVAGTWEALTADRVWTRKRVGVGSSVVTFLVEIRLIATPGVILASATITLTAEVEFSE